MQKMNKKIISYILGIIFCVGVIIAVLYNNTNVFSNDLIVDNMASNNILEMQQNNNGVVNNADTEAENTEIYIHIIGEVNNQGIVKLQEGARIIDAIEKAGGTTEFADVSKVNLAFVLSDGQKVHIPNINDNIDNFVYVTDSSGDNIILESSNNSYYKDKVNINTASQTQLELLSGIGPSTAAKIIQYREKNGKFKSIEDIKNVSGIGEAKFNSIKDSIIVK